MTIERAHEVSLALAAARIGHTLHVGYAPCFHPGGPTEYGGVVVRVDLSPPSRHALPAAHPPDSLAESRARRLSERLAEVEAIADRFDLEVETSLMGEGLTLSPRR